MKRHGADRRLGLQRPFEANGDPPHLALLDPVVVRFVGESERQDSLGDEVRAVDAGEALGHDGANAEIERREDALAPCSSPARSCGRRRRCRHPTPLRAPGSRGRSAGTCSGRTRGCSTRWRRRARRRAPCPRSRRRRARRSATRPSIASGRGGTSGGGTMFEPFSSSTPLPLSGGAMNCPSVTDGSGARRRRQLRRLPQVAGVRDLAPQRGRGRRCRRAEVDAVAGRAAAAREVPVEGPHGDGARRRRLAHADARPARRLENPRARGKSVGVDAAANEQVEDLPRARRERQIELLRQRPPAKDGRDDRQRPRTTS